MHTTHVADVCTECAIVICQLIGSKVRKTERKKDWLNWLANSSNMKQTSLPSHRLVSWLWSNFPRRSSSSKNVFLPTCSFFAVRNKYSSAQDRGYSGYTPQPPRGFTCVTIERKWKAKSSLSLEALVAKKNNAKRGLFQENAPISSGNFPRWSRKADLTSDLNKGLLILICKK